MAQTNVSEDGTETRNYPYSNMFSHVVGYDTNGKSGLESEANFTLLTSHSFFLTQMKNQFLNEKNTGDTVVSTLNANLQSIAYNALGDRRGAVVVMEPSTGKRLVEVSKPDFDPNTIGDNLSLIHIYFAQVKYDGRITYDVACFALNLLEVDQYGLDKLDRQILTTLIVNFKGGPVGLDTLAAAIGEDSGTLEDVYEPYLLKNGFLNLSLIHIYLDLL